jgi:molecular chaperone DnaJ
VGLSADFTTEELKSKYKELMKKYHPDLYANAPSEERQLAETKTRDINEAFEYLSDFSKSGSTGGS